MEATGERDLHKSLELLPWKSEKVPPLFIDLRLKSSNLREGSRITLPGRSQH
jgi:hypothetical protein